jgi:DNA-directed RNA polymerase subunit RPC12/RpoP
VYIPLDYFRCVNCSEILRACQVKSGTACRCPYCGQQQLIPGAKKGFWGKLNRKPTPRLMYAIAAAATCRRWWAERKHRP